jgi:hypothetical protein
MTAQVMREVLGGPFADYCRDDQPMRDIPFEVRTHIEKEGLAVRHSDETGFSRTIGWRKKWEFAPSKGQAIRRSPGFPVRTFQDLVHCVAELSAANPRVYPLFRGQNRDYLNSAGGSMLYPSLFRLPPGKERLSRTVIKQRFRFLSKAIAAVRSRVQIHPWQSPLSVHLEFWVALLQHYQLAATPLIDLTQSLRLAATFALSDSNGWATRDSGYLFVLGLPNAPACLAPMVDEQMLLVRLQSVCPPRALRPHFQEGFLVGRWPLSIAKLKGDNAAYRLIGKYRLLNPHGYFWNTAFSPLPRAAVYPPNDTIAAELSGALASLAIEKPR